MIRNGIKMRSDTSVFKNRPGASKIVVHCRIDLQNTETGLSDNVVMIHRKPILPRKCRHPPDVDCGAYGYGANI